MDRSLRIIGALFLSATLISSLYGCTSNGESEGPPGTTEGGSWDEMVWDKGKWG